MQFHTKGFTKVESSIRPLVSSNETAGTIYTLVSGQVHTEKFKTAPIQQLDTTSLPTRNTHALITPIYLSSDSTKPVSIVTYLDLSKREFL